MARSPERRQFVTLLLALFWILNSASFAAAEFLDEEEFMDRIRLNGFVSQGYLITDRNNYLADTEDGSFEFSETGLTFHAEVTDQIRLGIQVLARDVGPVGNLEPEIDWASADWQWRNWLGVRAGILRTRLGFYNETRDTDMLRTSILLPQSVYNEFFRDRYNQIQGVGLYGLLDAGVAGSFSYLLQYGTDDVATDGAVSRSFESVGLGKMTDADVGDVYNAGLTWNTPLDALYWGLSLRLGVSFHKTTEFLMKSLLTVPHPLLGSVDIPAVSNFHHLQTVVGSAEFRWEDLLISAEYARTETVGDVSPIGMQIDDTAEGYYISAGYRLTDWLEAGIGASLYWSLKDDRDGDRFEGTGRPDYSAWQHDYSVSLRFDINEYWIVKAEAHAIDGVNLVMTQDNPDGLDQRWHLFLLKTTVSF